MPIIYINGINTSEIEANGQARLLGDLTGRKCELCYNKTATAVVDLMESLYNRWAYWLVPLPVTRKLRKRIRSHLSLEATVHVVAHSQGTVIAMNAVRGLTLGERKRVTMTLFAPVATQEPDFVDVEYFRNEFDYVVQALPGTWILRLLRRMQGKRKERAGKTHVRRGAKGHALTMSYLKHLKDFETYESSGIWRIINESRFDEWYSRLVK